MLHTRVPRQLIAEGHDAIRVGDTTVCCERDSMLTARAMSFLLEDYRHVEAWAGMAAAASI